MFALKTHIDMSVGFMLRKVPNWDIIIKVHNKFKVHIKRPSIHILSKGIKGQSQYAQTTIRDY